MNSYLSIHASFFDPLKGGQRWAEEINATIGQMLHSRWLGPDYD